MKKPQKKELTASAKEVTYDVSSLAVEAETKLEADEGYGREVVIREFRFALRPGGAAPTKAELLTPEYLRHLNDILWADSLELFRPPKVVINKTDFRIYAPCVAKKGALVLQKPATLSEYASGQSSKGYK